MATSVALIVPYLVVVEAPWPVLGVAAVLASWGLLVAWQRRRGGLDPRWTARFAQLESIVAAAAYVLLVAVDGGRRPTATVLLAAGIVATVAILSPPSLRSAVQATTVLAAGTAVGLAGTWLDGAFVAALLGVVAVVANAYAGERLAAIERQDRARRDVSRRTRLLATIERLPDDDAEDAARAVVATLRELAYDAAAVELVRDDHLDVIAIDGLPALPAPRGQGLGWQAILERRTVTTDRYPRTAWRLPGREGVHAGVATPILVEGVAIGCVIGLRVAAEAATAGDMEIAEVLAVHLGTVLGRLERERWQRAQLDQLDRLRHLHAELAVALGAELRGPLAEFRRLGAAVVAADASEQPELAERLARRTEDVLLAVEALLDAGRAQAGLGAPERTRVGVVELLAPVADATGVEVELGQVDVGSLAPQVWVVAPFVQQALELLLRSGCSSAAMAECELPAGRPSGRLAVQGAPGHLAVVVERDQGQATGVAQAVAARLLRSAGAELDVDAGAELLVRLPSAVVSDEGHPSPAVPV